MSKHRQGPRHKLAPGRKAGRIPREYRQAGLGHRAVVEHPLAAFQAGAFTLALATAVMWFFHQFAH